MQVPIGRVVTADGIRQARRIDDTVPQARRDIIPPLFDPHLVKMDGLPDGLVRLPNPC
jgi:hypothetical protein